MGASADFPVFDINPFPHMYTMMMRKNKGTEESLPPEEDKITLEQAVRTYTLDAAYILGIESSQLAQQKPRIKYLFYILLFHSRGNSRKNFY